jgi:hypothetical protein
LGNLGYALTFLRLFDSRFYRSTSNPRLPPHPPHSTPTVGLLFAALAGLLFIIALIRSQHSQHDFADRTKEDPAFEQAVLTHGQETKRVYGRPFVTAGWIVISVTIIVAIAEIGLLALIVQI